MRIEQINRVVYEIIDTDSNDFPTYRRSENGEWENLVGESWEIDYDDDDLEKMYNDFKAVKIIISLMI